jgi:BASS family bile acid:Na+ symporter
MPRLIRWLSESYLVIMAVALAVGLLVPQAQGLVWCNTYVLQVIFFLSCIKIDPKQVGSHLKDWKFLLWANFLMLFGFPIAVWLVGGQWAGDFGFALYLLAAMPVGMTAPLLSEVVGGKQTLALVLTVTTSLLAPFTIPLLTQLTYGASVSVDAPGMFKQLALVVFLPFALAMAVRRIWPKAVKTVAPATKPVAIVLLGVLIAGAVAKQASAILSQAADWPVLLGIVVLLFVFFTVLHVVGYYAFWWKKHEFRATSSVSLTYMNFTLAIFLASQFFPRPGVLMPLVLSILPWAVLPAVWKKLASSL